jgi:hypothetical protein
MGVSWFGGGAVSSSRPADARAARAAAVKDGRRPPPQAARSVLDGGEHDATLKAARAKNQPMALFRLTPKGERSLNREPTAKPASTAPFKLFRIDPLNREPMAKPAPTAPFKPFRIDPLNREPATKPAPTAPSPAGSNAPSAAATAQPARALHPIAPTHHAQHLVVNSVHPAQ